jgi:short-subunit dehydrogenase
VGVISPGAVVLVTGAGNGIGRATALELAARGVELVAVDRDEAALVTLVEEVGGLPVAVDVTDPGHAELVVARTLDTHGRIDAVVAVAGVGYAGEFAAMPAEEITRLLDVNLRAPMLLARAALPSMLERRSGTVVLVTSIAGTVPVPTEAAYCASKAALESFADALREEVRGHGIVVSAVRPGVVHTAFLAQRGLPYDRRWPRPVPATQLARAIVEVIDSGAERRTEPRWLGLAAVARQRMPWLYRPLARRFG